MSINYRKSLLAGVIATLAASPGWSAPQQAQPPQPERQHNLQQTGEAPGPGGGQQRLLPEYSAPAKSPTGHAAQGDESLISALTPRQLKQMEVVGASGEKIGKVADIVRSRKDGFIYAIISSGGVLGIGAKETPVSLKAMEVQGSKLRIGATKSDLPRWPEYRKDQFVELHPANKPISDFAAFEVVPSKDHEKAPPSK
jgi:sporulation protein YlmC with PRC-barrel domain